MLYPTLYLRRTSSVVRTVMHCLAFISHERCATFGTCLHKFHRLCAFLSALHIHTHNLRDYLSSLFHIHIVSQMQVETADEVLVVESGTLHHRSRKLHRLHVCHRGHGSRSPHLECHAKQSGALTLSLKLICYCPSRTLGCISQLPLLGERVHLQHYSICCHRQIFSLHVPLVYKGVYLFERVYLHHARADFESPLPCMFQIVVVTVRWQFG